MALIPGATAHRLENRAGSEGWSDILCFAPGGRTAFVESKYLYNPSNPFERWAGTQRSFAEERLTQGHRVLVCVGDERALRIWKADRVLGFEAGDEVPEEDMTLSISGFFRRSVLASLLFV